MKSSKEDVWKSGHCVEVKMRKRRIMISLVLSAGMLMCSGCEKKADIVEGYTEKSTAAESGETAAEF